MHIGKKIKYLRERQDISQVDLGKILNVSNSTISLWEKGKTKPKTEDTQKLCEYFGVGISELTNPNIDITNNEMPENVFFIPGSTKIPLLGEVCAGEGIIANPEPEYVYAPDWVHADLALRCKGDSMINARINDGDIVYIRKQDIVENGEIAAIELGEEAVLKRVYYAGDNLILQPENTQYAPIIAPRIDFENGTSKIIGKAVAFTSMLR